MTSHAPRGLSNYATYKRQGWGNTSFLDAPSIMRLEGGFVAFMGAWEVPSPPSLAIQTRDA